MKKFAIVGIFLLCFLNITALSVGQYTNTFTDPARNNRQIQTQIFYPIDESNPDASYPYIIFGHGWITSYTFTQTLTDALVNLGWIVAYPRTEEGLFPNHQEFALDLAFLKGAVYSENNNSTSVLFNITSPIAVVMGYSMGGGCAVIAASHDTTFASIVTFAAAETNPSAISAAFNINVPSVTFSGSSDTIAPPSSNQVPIYDNLSSLYKAYVSINGAGHLNLCSNGLLQIVLEPWLEYIKTGQMTYIIDFELALSENSTVLTYMIDNNLVVSNLDNAEVPRTVNLTVYPNPMSQHATLSYRLTHSADTALKIYNLKGQCLRTLLHNKVSDGIYNVNWDCKSESGKNLPAGIYLVTLTVNGKCTSIAKAILIH